MTVRLGRSPMRHSAHAMTRRRVRFVDRVRKPMAALLGVASLTLSILTLVAPARAEAAGRPYIWTSSADMFWCTSTQWLCSQTTVTRIPQSTELTMLCWRDDRRPFGGNSSPRWFYSVLDNGQEGFVWSEQIRNQNRNTPNCSTVNWINVSDWAIGRIGLTTWRSAAQDGPSRPANPGNFWSGYCLAFASNAWNVAGGSGPITGDWAIHAWDRYKSQGRADTSRSRPPRGALVFWQNSLGYGHVAISLGNWKVVTTDGTKPSDALPLRDASFDPGQSPFGTYLGWVVPTSTMPYNTR